MYFGKLCWFAKAIRSFSFTVTISLRHKKAPTFMRLNPSEICSRAPANRADPEQVLHGSTHTCSEAETHTKHFYKCMCGKWEHIGSPSLPCGSRTVVSSLRSCQIVVTLFEMSRATSDARCSPTCQPRQRSALCLRRPPSQGLAPLSRFAKL